jgi:RimJ/RimL family protein N-acetyltransferase
MSFSHVAIDFATYLGYFGMYVDTFTSNKAILRIVEKIGGFQKVGVLPVGGKLQGGQIVSSVIFIKYLTLLNFVIEQSA